ncbi:hypothetical protein L3X38_033074 [Prunus dulcis]|uniref:Uncharacterized protein n=1 Tax=Prunus dulcis TaxID=3755 RepID=A0AAD4VHD9_PRUDU|nr:hypothetical protein L3X38_033074 [Prunus dulcis]
MEQGVQLRKRKRIIPMWKIIEASELVQKTLPKTTRLWMLDPMKVISHDDMVKLLKLCWEWRHNSKITSILALQIIKEKKEQVRWKIRNSLLNVVNGKVPVCGMDWQSEYKVYAPYEILKEELAPLSITIPNLLNTIDFYEEGVYANDCSRDWQCPWPMERVDVPQQSNQ